jgi:2-methylcitrate dehydratase PrpD
MTQPTRSLAEYVCRTRDGDFPALARSRAVDAITDCVACMFGGCREPVAMKMLNITAAGPRTKRAPALLLGTADYATATDAALYNGAVAHALDYDDTNHPGYAHVGAAVVPALFAIADTGRANGRDLVTAFILGVEVIGKLGRALNPAHMKQGWHPTATFGTLAATVAAGRVLRLDEAQMVMALGIAASAAGGWRANFGTMVKPLHAGYAARNGVLAALLAREGMVATDSALEHRYGYCNVMTPGGCDFSQLQSWGRPLEILTDYGLALKPYPSCGATHAAIEAALQLHAQLGGAPIRAVRAGVSELAFEPLIYVEPKTPLQGKFSLHYCIAAALVDGVVNLATFSDKVFANPALHALIPKITMEADDRVRHDPEFASVISLETVDGRRFESFVPLAAGKPERWFSRTKMHDKFSDCASGLLNADAIERVFSRLQALDGDAGANKLLDSLVL